MDSRALIRRTLLAVAIPVALAASAPPASAVGPGMEEKLDAPSETLTTLQGLEGSAFEVAFLKQMTQHHRSAIAMARLASERAASGQLKSLAARMAKMQESEVSQMTGWLDQWHNATPGPRIVDERAEREAANTLEQLRVARGQEFDRLFVTSMTKHHREGIALAELLGRKSARGELQAFAVKMKDAQAKEIDEMATSLS